MPKSEARQFMEDLCGPLTFGGLLKAIREADEHTLLAFASLLCLPYEVLWYLEDEQILPSPTLAARIARNLGYSEEQFVELAKQ